jgi:hypothetical protein
VEGVDAELEEVAVAVAVGLALEELDPGVGAFERTAGDGMKRFRRILAEERPVLRGCDQDARAARLRYREADEEEALPEFAAVRTGPVRLRDGLAASDLARAGAHAERGEESVARMVLLQAGHDQAHLAQMRRISGAPGFDAGDSVR